MELNLKRPLIFFDIESTGLNTIKDRIVEISVLKVHPDGKEEIKTQRINPEMPIPQESSKIHGITDEDVKDKPTFKQVAKSLANFMEGCDIAGFNSVAFDIPILEEEFIRAEVDYDFRKRKHVDIQTIFHKMEPRTLVAAYRFYCDKELENAHSAQGDTIATYEVFKAQLHKYQGKIENDIEALAKFTSNNKVDFAGRFKYDDNGKIVFNFGKHKGKLVTEILKKEPSYYDWMMKGEFPRDTQRILTDIKLHPEKYS